MAVQKKLHSNKEIEKAIRYAENAGWRYKNTSGSAHAWGRLLCPLQARKGCSISIWSTPKNGDTHAKQIRKSVDSCSHNRGDL